MFPNVTINAVFRLGHRGSPSGSLDKAAERAYEIRANTLQIFSARPRMWRAKPRDPWVVRLFTKAREKFDLTPLAIHDSYLINLASVTPALHAQSVDAFRGELERAISIGADYLVMHPGSCKG